MRESFIRGRRLVDVHLWLATRLSAHVPGLSTSGPLISGGVQRDAVFPDIYVLIKLEISDTFTLQRHQDPLDFIFPLVIVSEPGIYI